MKVVIQYQIAGSVLEERILERLTEQNVDLFIEVFDGIEKRIFHEGKVLKI